jgi:hypothetical protein
MKRLSFALALIALSAALFAQAQTPSPDQAQTPSPDQAKAPGAPQQMAPQATLVTLNGTLTFIDDRPAIKTDTDTVYLEMPNFFKYAYFDGIKAGVAVKATGMLVTPPAFNQKPQDPKDGKAAAAAPATAQKPLSVLIAKEVTIGNKTYIIASDARDMVRAPEGAPRDGEPRAGGDQGQAQAGDQKGRGFGGFDFGPRP